MNKRQRTAGPDQWSSFSKAWNASALAKEVTKLTDENVELTTAIQTCSHHLNSYTQLYEKANNKYEKYDKLENTKNRSSGMTTTP